MPLVWDTPPAEAVPQMVETYWQQMRAALFALANAYAPQIENWMKDNAPWTDRTGNARQTLWAEAFDFVDAVVIAFGHGVEYGTFLELAHQGRYAVITPALDEFAPRIWQDVVALVS